MGGQDNNALRLLMTSSLLLRLDADIIVLYMHLPLRKIFLFSDP
jgi:hypothetical protein